MPRLIDAEHLKKRATDLCGDCWDNYAQSTEDFLEYIDNEPTVDAVRHGHWINDFSSPLKCSSCGIVSKANEITLRTDFKFCPYCGAKMDEVEDAENNRCR